MQVGVSHWTSRGSSVMIQSLFTAMSILICCENFNLPKYFSTEIFYEYSKHENENVVMAWMAIAKESHIISVCVSCSNVFILRYIVSMYVIYLLMSERIGWFVFVCSVHCDILLKPFLQMLHTPSHTTHIKNTLIFTALWS